jgi:hypothetical protein
MLENEWDVNVRIKGSISLDRPIILDDVTIRQKGRSLEASVQVSTDTPKKAQDIAVRKIHDVLDVISTISEQNLEIEGLFNITGNNYGSASLPASFNIKRILNTNDLENIATLSNMISRSNTTVFLRALSYYRKGFGSVDPFDGFFSFWQSIEIITNKFEGDTIRNKAQNMFNLMNEDLMEDFESYRIMRNNIVHGNKPRDISQIQLVSEKIEGIKHMSRKIINKIIQDETFRRNVFDD